MRFVAVTFTVLVMALFLSTPVQMAFGTAQQQVASSTAQPAFGGGAFQPQGKIVAPQAYNWPMYGGSANHTGAVTSPAPLTNHLVRNVNLSEQGTVRSSPALYNDILFIARGSVFHALNASTMTYNATISQGWNYTLPTGGSVSSSPAVGGGSVFFGATDGKVYGFQAQVTTCSAGHPACHLEWVFGTNGPVLSSPTYYNGMVFIGSDDGRLYCINASSGAPVWHFQTNGNVRSSPAVANSMVAFGSDDGRLYVLDAQTGAMLQVYRTKGPVESSPAVSGGIAYFGSNDSSVYAVNESTGTTVWKFATGGPVIASPSVADSRVYVGSTDGYFYSFMALHNKHQLVWKTLVGPVVAPASLANGVILHLSPTYLPMAYVISTSGKLEALVRSSGAINWTLSIAANTLTSPVVAYTKIYFCDSRGNLTEMGGIRGSTAIGTFGPSGLTKKFIQGSEVLIGTNTAWGKYGINQSLVTITDPLGHLILINASMLFATGNPAYNFQYGLALGSSAATGIYHVTVLVEDGNAKVGSANPRCCGWIVVKTTFKVVT